MRTTAAYLVHDSLWIGVWLRVGGWWPGVDYAGIILSIMVAKREHI